VVGPPPRPADGGPSLRKKVGSRVGGIPLPAPSAPSVNYRAVVHAFA
jgi:hypothetical protein